VRRSRPDVKHLSGSDTCCEYIAGMAADETHSDKLDDDLTDDDLESEIELVGRLVVAATSKPAVAASGRGGPSARAGAQPDQTAAEPER